MFMPLFFWLLILLTMAMAIIIPVLVFKNREIASLQDINERLRKRLEWLENSSTAQPPTGPPTEAFKAGEP